MTTTRDLTYLTQPMAEGGVWLQPAGGPPTYVTHASHISRLTIEGWLPVVNPRPAILAQQEAEAAAKAQEAEAAAKAQQSQKEAMEQEIAELKAALAAKNERDTSEASKKQVRGKAE